MCLMQQRRACRSIRGDGEDGIGPGFAAGCFGKGGFDQSQPTLRLRVLAANLVDALSELRIAYVPAFGKGPEHLTFGVRQGVL